MICAMNHMIVSVCVHVCVHANFKCVPMRLSWLLPDAVMWGAGRQLQFSCEAALSTLESFTCHPCLLIFGLQDEA